MASDFHTPDFEKIAREALKDLPHQVAETARNHFMKSFIKEGWEDVSFKPWVKRQDDFTHKLLQASLALKNSIKITEETLDRVEITGGVGIPYAAIHNDGGTLTVPVTDKMRRFFWAMWYKTGDELWKGRALTTKEAFIIEIPQRQFMGESDVMAKKIDKLIIDSIKKAEKTIKF